MVARKPSTVETSLRIESLAYGGAGVGRFEDGRVCFVHGTLPGERVAVRVIKSKKNHAEAAVLEILEASPHRVAPACPLFGSCGGCAYQHADYPLQLETKTSQVTQLLRRIGGIPDAPVSPMLPSPEVWGYRNRIAVHTEHGRTGFFHRHTHTLVDVAACPISSPEVNEKLSTFRKKPPRQPGRYTIGENAAGRGFTQVNAGAAEILASVVSTACGGGELLVDAYSGAGFFSKRLVERFHKVVGIEWSEAASQRAMEFAAPNESHLTGSVEALLPPLLANAPSTGTTLIVDPPSEGLSADVLHAIFSTPPTTLVYVSCDPSTFARDTKSLLTHYSLESVQPVDMFPQTAEIELAAVFKRHAPIPPR